MIGLPTPSEYARLSYSQRVRVLDRLDQLKLAYLDTERPNGQIRRPVPTRPAARPPATSCSSCYGRGVVTVADDPVGTYRECDVCDGGRR